MKFGGTERDRHCCSSRATASQALHLLRWMSALPEPWYPIVAALPANTNSRGNLALVRPVHDPFLACKRSERLMTACPRISAPSEPASCEDGRRARQRVHAALGHTCACSPRVLDLLILTAISLLQQALPQIVRSLVLPFGLVLALRQRRSDVRSVPCQRPFANARRALDDAAWSVANSERKQHDLTS